MGREVPQCLPVRSVLMNISSVQMPRPVLRSGVRFAVKLTPHGPAKAVFVGAADQVQPFSPDGRGGTLTSSGWPESIRDISGSGPFWPIFHGVWQSLQPMIFTR